MQLVKYHFGMQATPRQLMTCCCSNEFLEIPRNNIQFRLNKSHFSYLALTHTPAYMQRKTAPLSVHAEHGCQFDKQVNEEQRKVENFFFKNIFLLSLNTFSGFGFFFFFAEEIWKLYPFKSYSSLHEFFNSLVDKKNGGAARAFYLLHCNRWIRSNPSSRLYCWVNDTWACIANQSIF